jgi:hypothetical protein
MKFFKEEHEGSLESGGSLGELSRRISAFDPAEKERGSKVNFWRLVRIKFASFALQLVHVVAGGIVRGTRPGVEGLRTMNAGGLHGRAEVRQPAQQVRQSAERRETREGI